MIRHRFLLVPRIGKPRLDVKKDETMKLTALSHTVVLPVLIVVSCSSSEEEMKTTDKGMRMMRDPNALISFSDKSCIHDEKNFRCVKYLKNYDGDTVTFDIKSVHPLLGNKISVRASGVDTPEMKTKDKCEKEKARQAKRTVASVLSNAKRIDLENISRGKYFRIVADVKFDGKSLSKYLADLGLAYQYNGGKKTKIDWCRG